MVGLSLPLLRDLLARLGVSVPELWATSVAGTSAQGDPGAGACRAPPGAAADAGPAAGVVWRTPRLVIRSMGAEHARTLAAYRSDPEVARYQSWDAPFTLAQARAFVAGMAGLDPVSPGRWVQLAIEADGEHVGDVAVRVDEDGRQARVGITLAGDAQGRGWGTEALGAVLDRLFAAGLHRVVADCDVRNEASWRLLERVGHASRGAPPPGVILERRMGRRVRIRGARRGMAGLAAPANPRRSPRRRGLSARGHRSDACSTGEVTIDRATIGSARHGGMSGHRNVAMPQRHDSGTTSGRSSSASSRELRSTRIRCAVGIDRRKQRTSAPQSYGGVRNWAPSSNKHVRRHPGSRPPGA